MKIESLEQLIKASAAPASNIWTERRRKQDEAAAKAKEEFYEAMKKLSPEYYEKLMADVQARKDADARRRAYIWESQQRELRAGLAPVFARVNAEATKQLAEMEKAQAAEKAKQEFIASLPPPNVPEIGKHIADSAINTNQNLVTHVAQKDEQATRPITETAKTEEGV